jgi:GxxExxY protein
MDESLLHHNITGKIISAFYEVYRTLGYGFLEKVYENALAMTLREMGMLVRQQYPINVYFKEQLVGYYFADLVVDQLVIVEVKAAEGIAPEHLAQLLNYLRATDIEVGLLLNFGPEPTFRRKVFSNLKKAQRKTIPQNTSCHHER